MILTTDDADVTNARLVTPEIYHRLEPPGLALPFDDDGRTRGLADAARTTAAQLDADIATVLAWVAAPQRAGVGLGAAPNATRSTPSCATRGRAGGDGRGLRRHARPLRPRLRRCGARVTGGAAAPRGGEGG